MSILRLESYAKENSRQARACASALMMEAVSSFETSVNCTRLHGITSRDSALLKLPATPKHIIEEL
jgi:hypothetical protein